MCLNPLQIVNPSKYVSVKYRDRFLLNVPCGKCAECQQTLSNQWFLRCWYECLDTQSFIYFDTLTYNDASLPLMSDILPELPRVSCFRSSDIRKFIESLRLRLKRSDNVSFRYFIASEYGSYLYTHRPHYHVLFFVNGDIKPEKFSFYVSQYWKHGITDGLPYKSLAYVLDHNVISAGDLPAKYLRACRYVTKYVQKSCLFDKTSEAILNNCMLRLEDKLGDDWSQSVNARRVRMALKRHLTQFHRQSQGFGSSALASIDLKDLFETGCLYMPSPKGLKVPVPLPMYYKRKMFYDLKIIDGCKTWILNELGQQYNQYRQTKLIKDLSDTFYSASLTFHLGLSSDYCYELADYVYNSQGRINADKPSSNFFEKLESVTFYNYVTLSDKENLGHRGIINRFIGNNTIGYTEDALPPFYRIGAFINKFVVNDETKEKHLSLIYYYLSCHNEKLQSAYELRQHLEDVYKDLRRML